MPFNIGGYIYNGGQADTQDYYNIVTRGLVLNLDASAPSSYPGSGTSWNSIAQTYATTLTNGPTYSTDGYFTFDDTNDYVEVLSNGNVANFTVQSYTIETIIYPTVDPDTNEGIMWSYDYTAHSSPYYSQHLRLGGSGGTNDEIGFYWNDGANYQGFEVNNAIPTLNIWYYISATYTSGYQAVYINGSVAGSTTRTDTISYYNQPIWISKANFGGYFGGRIAVTRFYNRALAAAEILQNFKVQRSRFGI